MTARNRKAILRLAKFIENAKYEFDMGEPNAKPCCGTAGCIAGHAAVLWRSVRTPSFTEVGAITWDEDKLQSKLGIDWEQEDALFFPDDIGLIDRRCAVRALRRFARTGKIQFDLNDCEKKP